MNSFILQCNKYMNSYIKRIHISMNSYIQTIEFIECMTLYIVWVHTFTMMRKKIFWNWTIDHIIHATTPPLCHLAALFLKYIYCMHYMILMSKKMTSQKKLGEIELVPYQTPFFVTNWFYFGFLQYPNLITLKRWTCAHPRPPRLHLISRLCPVTPACFWLVVVFLFVVWWPLKTTTYYIFFIFVI